MTETEKSLAVPDMTEEKQWVYLAKAGLMPHPWNAQELKLGIKLWRWKAYFKREVKDKFQALLADLAFRIRDEVSKIWIDWGVGGGKWAWGSALQEVYCFVTKKPWDGIEFRKWFVYESRPIHWIVAAIRAKKIAKDK